MTNENGIAQPYRRMRVALGRDNLTNSNPSRRRLFCCIQRFINRWTLDGLNNQNALPAASLSYLGLLLALLLLWRRVLTAGPRAGTQEPRPHQEPGTPEAVRPFVLDCAASVFLGGGQFCGPFWLTEPRVSPELFAQVAQSLESTYVPQLPHLQVRLLRSGRSTSHQGLQR